MLIAVVGNFRSDADPDRDRQEPEPELVVADRDHVEKRLERVRSQAKSSDPRLRQGEALERVARHVEAAIRSARTPACCRPSSSL